MKSGAPIFVVLLVTLLTCTIVFSGDQSDASPIKFTSGDFEYEILSDTTVSISGFVGSDYSNVGFHSTIFFNMTTYSVVAISDNAFRESDFSGKLKLPSSIKTIGSYAFYGCENLTIVSIRDVQHIGDHSFANCENLSKIEFGNSLKSICSTSFSYSFKDYDSSPITCDASNLKGKWFIFEESSFIRTVPYMKALIKQYPVNANDPYQNEVWEETRWQDWMGENGEPMTDENLGYALCLNVPIDPIYLKTDDEYYYDDERFNVNRYLVIEKSKDVPSEWNPGEYEITVYYEAYFYRFYSDGICYEVTSTIPGYESVKIIGTLFKPNTIPETVTYAERTFNVNLIENDALSGYDGIISLPINIHFMHDGIEFKYTTTVDDLNKLTVIKAKSFPSIPDSIVLYGKEYVVTELASNSIESVDVFRFEIPNTIESIQENAFKGYTFYDESGTEILHQNVTLVGHHYYVSDNDDTRLIRAPVCTISFKNWDGVTLYSKDYLYGDVPEYVGNTPVKPSDAEFTYTFSNWSPSIGMVTKDQDYQAIYSKKVNSYEIRWLYDDSSLIDTTIVDYGVVPSHSIPQKQSTVMYDYVFVKWSPSVVSVTESTTYTAVFDSVLRYYNLTWDYGIPIDGVPAKVDRYQYGERINKIEDPVLKGFTFLGWDDIPETMPAENLIIAAYWQLNYYTITFDTDGGSTIESIVQSYGADIKSPQPPVKEGYTFVKWDKELPETMPDSNMTLTAIWKLNQYSIVFRDDSTIYGSYIVNHGELPTYAGTVPTKTPTKELIYTFTGWSPEISIATKNTEYYPTFSSEPRLYDVTFYVNSEEYYVTHLPIGSRIAKPTIDPEPFTQMGKKYTFIGWNGYNGAIVVSGDISFDALFSEVDVQYMVQFKVDNTVIDVRMYNYNETIVCPNDPVKEQDDEFTYSFIQWSDYSEGMTVTSDHTFVAEFFAEKRLYDIRFITDSEIFYSNQQYYGELITLPDEPTYDSNDSYCYDFIGWNGYYNGMTVSGSHIFSALFEISIESLDSLIEQASSTNVILIKMMPNSQITLDDVELERILEALSAEGDRKFTLSYDNGKISFDKNSLDSFKWDGIDADIEQVVELTEKEIEATNDRPTYEIKLKNKDGSIKEFKKNSKDGKITIDLPYKLKDGEDKNNLYVSYMENGELKESHDCLYYEEEGIGYVSFSTTHLSKYVIMYDSSDSGPGMNCGLIIGGSAILVAILGAGIIFFVRRKI